MKQRHDEPFPAFAARLTAVMNMTTHSDITKIKELRKRMISRLRNLVLNIEASNNYRQYIHRVSTIANNVAELQHEKSNEDDNQVKPKSRYQQRFFNKSREYGTSSSKDKQDRKSIKKTPNAVDGGMARLDKETKKLVLDKGACAKCFVPGHIATQADAPCRTSPPVSIGEAKTKLAALGVHWTPTDEDSSSDSSEDNFSSDSEN